MKIINGNCENQYHRNLKMNKIRLIARLDIKGPNLIKGIRLEGLRIIGSPGEYALKYYQNGIDELIYMDTVASLYGRNNLHCIIKKAVKNIFVPITVGGGIRSTDDVTEILRSGADKVAINTAAVSRPLLINEVAKKFGSQSMVLSVEAKKIAFNKWEVFTDNGREHSGKDVLEWVKQGVDLGAGEILLTSVDREGTRRGFDLELVQLISSAVSVPIIASGGMGNYSHMIDVVKKSNADAVAMADILHYNRDNISSLRLKALEGGLEVRKVEYD